MLEKQGRKQLLTSKATLHKTYSQFLGHGSALLPQQK